MKKDVQAIQDTIFQKMSADKKLEIVAQFWRLARDLGSKEQKHERSYRSEATSGSRR